MNEQMIRLAALRKKVLGRIAQLEISRPKPYDGQLELRMPGPFDNGDGWILTLNNRSLGDRRCYQWNGDSLEECIDKAWSGIEELIARSRQACRVG